MPFFFVLRLNPLANLRSKWSAELASPIIHDMPTFISELRRRNILRAAAAYALIAWIIIEAGSVLMPTFGASPGAFQIYVIVVLGGFVLSLALAWIFEITDQGVKLDRDVDRSGPRDRQSHQHMNAVIIGLLILALAVSITFNVTDIRGGPPLPVAASERMSIAVLPFHNRSSDPDNLLFADGIHDDLLTRLANNKSLRVISRTSVMEYRNTTKKLPRIGEELGVDTILEGSVQRVGDTVRINMQLVDAASDEQVWAKVYDRNLTMQNIFAIQTDISAAISRALRAELIPANEGRMSRIPTDNLIAYNRYNEARSQMAKRERLAALDAKLKFEEAIEIDPEFADAYAGLATSILLLYINHQAIDQDEAYRLSEAAIDTALALDPELADAYATLGLLKLQIWMNTRIGSENFEAAAAFSNALELNPNHASAYMWFASLRQAEAKYNEAIELFEKSIEVDPLGRIPYASLPKLYAQLNQNAEALRLWIRAIEIHPDWPTPYEYIAVHLYALGRPDESLAWYYRVLDLTDSPAEAGNLSLGIYVDFGDIERARSIASSIPQDHPLFDMTDAFGLLFDQNPKGALTSMLAALEQKPNRPPFVYEIVADTALLAGDLDTARKFVLLHNPVLASDSELVINKFTMKSVVALAYIARQKGDTQKSYDMLTRALPVVQAQPRLGITGHGILDVQIFATLGRVEDAISALEEAVSEGFRSTLIFNTWSIRADPYLKSLENNGRFIALLETIDLDLRRMRENATAAEDSGDWDSLRQIAISAAHSDVLANAAAIRKH